MSTWIQSTDLVLQMYICKCQWQVRGWLNTWCWLTGCRHGERQNSACRLGVRSGAECQQSATVTQWRMQHQPLKHCDIIVSLRCDQYNTAQPVKSQNATNSSGEFLCHVCMLVQQPLNSFCAKPVHNDFPTHCIIFWSFLAIFVIEIGYY